MPPIPFKFLAASPMVLARTTVELVLSVEHYVPRNNAGSSQRISKKNKKQEERWQPENVERKGADVVGTSARAKRRQNDQWRENTCN